MELKWYTVYTEQKLEKKVTAHLAKKNITHFCPVTYLTKDQGKQKNNGNFSRYVFVKLAENQLGELRKTKGIKNFLYWMNKPAVVSESEIILMKRFLNEYSQVRIEKQETGFNPDTAYNAANENEAKLIYLNNNNQVKAALPSLGFMLIAEADFEKPVVQISPNPTFLRYLKPKLKYKIAK